MRRPALLLLVVGSLPFGLVHCEPSGAPKPRNSVRSNTVQQSSAAERSQPTAYDPSVWSATPHATPSEGYGVATPSASEELASGVAPFEHPPANTQGCLDGMVRVTGPYCLDVAQTCEEYHEEYLHGKGKGNGTVSDRCLKFKAPSRCIGDQRKNLDFCMDRYEYPNQAGELPWVLTSWRQAQSMCREQGKRLCTEDEYNFACEGPEMLPYVTGYERDPSKCNMDREYHQPNHDMRLLTYERCLADETCKAELERLDQRHAIGSSLSCVSWAGIVDLNGNVNEWVRRPHKEPPNRSGLKGGWWGPVRNRCRPTVGFHKEFDYGYEAGFRCCKGLGEETYDPRYEAERFRLSPEQLEQRKAELAVELETKQGAEQTALPLPKSKKRAAPNERDAPGATNTTRASEGGNALEPAPAPEVTPSSIASNPAPAAPPSSTVAQ